MVVASRPGLILFVSGEPGPAPDMISRDIVPMAPRMFGMLRLWARRSTLTTRGPEGDSGTPPASAEGVTWHVPAQEIGSVEMVRDAAKVEGRDVTLVNVNEPVNPRQAQEMRDYLKEHRFKYYVAHLTDAGEQL
jgi:hypothetical protein